MKNYLKNNIGTIINIIFLFIILNFTTLGQAQEELIFESGKNGTTLIELFTSQGCSSSPPAERWLNKFVNDPRLWNEIVPVQFHVDYWDRLGWKDPFSSNVYTQRQYSYKKSHLISSAYTPGVVVNGKEWRGWFSGKALPTNSNNLGVIRASLKDDKVDVNFDSKENNLILNVAILGIGHKTHVERGENRNRNLKEDFIVLAYDNYNSNQGKWSVWWIASL